MAKVRMCWIELKHMCKLSPVLWLIHSVESEGEREKGRVAKRERGRMRKIERDKDNKRDKEGERQRE